MVFDEEEGEFFVDDGCVGISLGGELVEQVEHEFQEGIAHDFAGLSNAPLYEAHYVVHLVQRLLYVQRIGTPQLSQKLYAV